MDGMDRVDRNGPYGQNGRGSEVYFVQSPRGAASSPRMRGAPGRAPSSTLVRLVLYVRYDLSG
jgi:hypothetical protein